MFGIFLTLLSYIIFSPQEDSVSLLENKHALIVMRIQTLENRIGQFDRDSESGEKKLSSLDNSVSLLKNKHALIMERIQTLENRIDQCEMECGENILRSPL